MTRYRRLPLTRETSLASLAVSVAVGAGAAAVTFYLTRLLLARDPLVGGDGDADLPSSATAGVIPASVGGDEPAA